MDTFDTFLDEVRHRFWERPRGTPDEYGYYGTALCDVAFEILEELPDDGVLRLISDLYLRRAELAVSIEQRHLLAPLVEDAVPSVLVAAAVGTLRQDDKVAQEDAIRGNDELLMLNLRRTRERTR